MTHPISVLMVDDEKRFRETTRRILERNGFRTILAANGAEALKCLDQSPDVAILDIRMPGMDGIETLKKIKAGHPLVEVILLTGHGSTETAVEGMKEGAFDYLMKPADFEDISEKLASARKRKDEQEERIRQAEARLLLRRSGDV